MDTIAAIATPPGRGGIGIIRLSGPDSQAIAGRICGTTNHLTPRHAKLTSFLDSEGRVLDSGLVLLFPAPASYTGEDVVELQAHGSPVLLRTLLDQILALGARLAEPGEFSRRAVENGRIHLDQAEAVAACIDALTLRAARQAQRHLQGEFGQCINTLMEELTMLLAHVEACLDFPEEEIPALLYEQLREDLERALLQPIEKLLSSAGFGERLFSGAIVAIIGAPNVGKSTLMNRLSGRERAIVSDIPGTTRDVLEADFDLHGIPVRLLDTAGIRESDDRIEQEGVRRAHHAASNADLTIMMSDATDTNTWRTTTEADLYVMNKCDVFDPVQQTPEHYLKVSAKDGQGVGLLLSQLRDKLGDNLVLEEDLLVTNSRHRQQLEYARAYLIKGGSMLGDSMSLDLVALEWRRAWSCLGEIVGIGDVEHILDAVFSQFCIGK